MAKKQQESQKNKNTKQTKAAADKTFGLKNKNKSTKLQQYVAQVESQTNSSAAAKRKQADNERKAAERKAAEAAQAEARALFNKAMPTQKVDVGVDPKSVVCAFFKQGLCNKGARCKFSHDLGVERKGAKRDLYSDERENDRSQDTMDKWDDEKLREVVLSKHGNPKTTTDKICKYFIEAVENGKYGWFWVCPNGGDTCKYRHSLPPGFKLKTKEEQRLERQAAANAPVITLEEFIETERAKLPKNKTPITFATFTEWKKKREEKKAKSAEEEVKNKKVPLTGRQLMLSGRYNNNTTDDDGGDSWDLEALRKETEAAREQAEKERIEKANIAAGIAV